MMIFDSIATPSMMARRIGFVTDRYLETSIKNARRGSHGALNVGTEMSQAVEMSLSNKENKTSLADFLLQQWSGNSYAHSIGRRIIFFEAGDLCVTLFVFSCKVMSEQVEELRCIHEEADNRSFPSKACS